MMCFFKHICIISPSLLQVLQRRCQVQKNRKVVIVLPTVSAPLQASVSLQPHQACNFSMNSFPDSKQHWSLKWVPSKPWNLAHATSVNPEACCATYLYHKLLVPLVLDVLGEVRLKFLFDCRLLMSFTSWCKKAACIWTMPLPQWCCCFFFSRGLQTWEV